MNTNFWDLHYLLYLIGFLLVPRLTVIFVFGSYVTNGFLPRNLFLPITVWWMFPQLLLGFWGKAGFSFLYLVFPRLLLGIIGCLYLPENRGFMICMCFVGFIIDVVAKLIRSWSETEQSA